MPTLAGNKQFFHPSLLIGRAFSIFRHKMDGTNPSETDNKVSVQVPIFCLQFETCHPQMGEDYIIPLVKKKNKIQDS